jgi:hypothetical protein
MALLNEVEIFENFERFTAIIDLLRAHITLLFSSYGLVYFNMHLESFEFAYI